MSKHINTHLFFHMNDHSSSSAKHKGSSGESSSNRKPKKSSNLFSGYEIDTNPPLPSETGDYYDYYTNYGIPDYGPFSPPSSPPYLYNNDDQYNYYDYRNQAPEYYDYYNQTNDVDNSAEYRDSYLPNYDRSRYLTQEENYPAQSTHNHSAHKHTPHNLNHNHPSGSNLPLGPSTSSSYRTAPNAYLQPPLISPPIQDPKRASPSSPFSNDVFSYRNDPQGLGAISHKLHRITFVEACIFQPPDLPSPSMPRAPVPPPQSHGPVPAVAPAPGRPGMPVLAQGERSPTSTGGTQYYQEWTSKHMRHLCSRFEKPAQQLLMMNVERKSKYPFIILCTPETDPLSKSSSICSAKARSAYGREMSQHSGYSLEDDEDDDEEEEANWITQKQRDSINSHYLPPPPPPLLMPHIWPEIKYIDGLYTVCASITRPGSGVPDDLQESHYLRQDSSSSYDHSSYSNDNPYKQTPERQFSYQESRSGDTRPGGYIVSAFATFPGEDSERLERNWLLWTGARILYKYLPMCVGLRRLIFLKRCPDMYRDDLEKSKLKPTIFTGFTYVLLCECFNLKDAYIASVCTTIDQLRARCCGYSALYLTHYQKQESQSVGMDHHQAHSSSAPTSSGSSHHHHHHIPRHHRSTDFSEFDNQL